jgi:hypothetical protein
MAAYAIVSAMMIHVDDSALLCIKEEIAKARV